MKCATGTPGHLELIAEDSVDRLVLARIEDHIIGKTEDPEFYEVMRKAKRDTIIVRKTE